MKLIDADKIHPDIRTEHGMLGISQGQLAYAPTINAIPIPEGATNGDMVKMIFPDSKILDVGDQKRIWLPNHNQYLINCSLEWWNSPYKRGDTE